MMNWKKPVLIVCIISAFGYAYWKIAIPSHRVAIRSELVMMGDLDGDNRWAETDLKILSAFLDDPFAVHDNTAWLLDMNRNGLVDPEDLSILRALSEAKGDPYAAEENARSKGMSFPRPRELYRYISTDEYRVRPLLALPYPPAKDSILAWLFSAQPTLNTTFYGGKLNAAIYAEAVRFDRAWRKRQYQLQPVEREYASRKLSQLKKLSRSGDQHELLLGLIELVEDAETLTTRGNSDLALKLLTFRDHLRIMLESSLFADLEAGRTDWRAIIHQLSDSVKTDIGITYDLENSGPPRSVTSLENYLQRSEWQYYKSSTNESDFRALINYAQHDPRYLAAVSRTNPKHRDPQVMNHNLPMVLLFREALRIMHNDKKKAVGLLDESIRIPYGWIKSIPRSALPRSLALENFLLPGNKEDGADKSRHWNVFGGLCLYKSPEEALDLALKREMQDLRDENYSAEALREFLRDMIANLNGMYHVMVLDPHLL